MWFPAAELGDPANHLTLNSTGGPEDPFSKTALMISTGDAETVGVWVYVRMMGVITSRADYVTF